MVNIRNTFWLLLLLLMSSIQYCNGDESPETAIPALQPPQLQPVFGDDFSTDTRADYTVTGDVSWESGKLTLAEGASIERAMNGGPWAKVELGLLPIQLTQSKPTSELRIWFVLDGATSCYVRLLRQLEADRTVDSLALVDTGEIEGKRIEQVVRSATIDNTPSGTLSVEYRHGLVRVTAKDRPLFAAYVANGSAAVGSLKLQSGDTAFGLRNYSAAAVRANPREHTAAEQVELAKAEAANHELLAHYREGKYTAAAEIGKRAVRIQQSILGRQHPDYALSLSNLAEVYKGLGDDSEAERLIREVMAIRKTQLGHDHPDYAATLNNLAGIIFSRSEFTEAANLYLEALQIKRAVLGPQHESIATNLNNLAEVYRSTGELKRAEPLLKEGLQIRTSLLGNEHPDVAFSLNSLASLYKDMQDYVTAEPLYQQAVEIRKRFHGESHPAYADSLIDLAGLCEEMGRFEQAESLYQQVLKIRRDRLGELHPEVALSLNNLAVLEYRIGDYGDAEMFYRQALEIARKVMQPQDPDYGLLLNNFAALCYSQADYVQAEPLYREALAINSIGTRKEGFAYVMSLNNLAALYKETGDFDRARALYGQAMAIHEAHAERDPFEYAATLNNLADVCSVNGDEQRAERLYLQAIETWKASAGEKTPDYANGLNNLAELYQGRGEPQLALPLLQQSIEVRRAMLGEHHPDYAYGLNSLAEWHACYGDSSIAEQLFQQAMEIRKTTLGDKHPEYLLSLHSLARFHCLKNNPSLAAEFASRAASTIQHNLNVNAVVQSERQQRANQTTERPLLDRFLVASLLRQGDKTQLAEAIWQWKGAVTARQRAYRQVAQSTMLAPLFADLQNVTRRISVLSGDRPVVPVVLEAESRKTSYAEELDAWKKEFESLSLKRESLERQIAAESNDFRRLNEAITVDAVRKNLAKEMAYVDFFQYRHEDMNIADDATKAGRNHEQRFLAVIVRKSMPVIIAKLGAADALGESVTQFRRHWQSDATAGEVNDSANQAAQEIRRMLWDPIDEHLDGVETVIISPDGILGTLPFAALPGKKTGSFLIEDYALSFVPTVSELQRTLDAQEQPTTTGKGLLILGDVNYDAATQTPKTDSIQRLLVDSGTRGAELQLHSGKDLRWAALPGFAAETQHIHNLFQKQFPSQPIYEITGTQATEAEFLAKAAGYGTLHLVTHGYFEEPEKQTIVAAAAQVGEAELQQEGIQRLIARYIPGLLSGVVMAGANHPSDSSEVLDDGILRSSEIEASSMQGVDLVVLSACETGLGSVAAGEGLTGLQRAFQVAGARSVVASLWKVDDAATVALMTEFYTNLWVRKQSKIDALRNAQLAILNHFDPVTNTLRRGLGTKPEKVASAKPNTKTTPDQSESRLDPAYWAAFQLSGDWR